MAKQKNATLQLHTFCKILLLLIIFAGCILILLNKFHPREAPEQNWQALEQTCQIKSDSLSKEIDYQINQFYRNLLYSAIDNIRADQDIKLVLKSWLAEHPFVWAVTLWQKEQNWPIRVLKEDFWNTDAIKNLNETSRREFFAAIFNNEKQYTDTIYIIQLPEQGLQLPLQEIAASVQHPVYHAVQIFSEDIDLKPILQLQLERNESVELYRNSKKIWESGIDGLHDKFNNRTSLKNRVFSSREALQYLDMQFVYKRIITEKPVSTSWIRQNVYLFSGVLIFSCILIALIASHWIVKPIHKLTEKALGISQGDFYDVIPPQKTEELNQLSQLINYMAHELARMQELNVGQIISDKIQTEAVIRNIADGVIVTDRDQRIIVVNKAAETWFGFKEKEIQSQKIGQFIRNNTLLELIDDLQKGKSQSSAEFMFIPFDSNQEKIFQAYASRVTNDENELIGIVTTIRDVTREREIDRIKTELVSMVAHELKSPLTSIFGFSELLLESRLKDPQLHEYAHIIMTESSRLTDLVNKFLDLTRLESGRTEIKMNPFDLNSVIDKMLESHIRQTESKAIKVIKEMPDNLPLVVGDQDMIEQVLLNLFSNAVKYSPKRSKVGIEAKEENGFVQVSIIDNGYGIPKESLIHIFDKFYRVPDTKMNGEVEGSGLGLTLAKEIIQHHGGEIKVQSRLGVGSVFNFTLQKANV